MIVQVWSNDIYSDLKVKVEYTLRDYSTLIDKIKEKCTNGIVVGILPRLTLYCLNQELLRIFCLHFLDWLFMTLSTICESYKKNILKCTFYRYVHIWEC